VDGIPFEGFQVSTINIQLSAMIYSIPWLKVLMPHVCLPPVCPTNSRPGWTKLSEES